MTFWDWLDSRAPFDLLLAAVFFGAALGFGLGLAKFVLR
jgi:hypothetical protein